MEPRTIIIAAFVGLACIAATLLGCLKQIGVRSLASPAGRVVRAGQHLVVLMEQCDPYMPSLKGVSESDKSYSHALWLIPESGAGEIRTIEVSRGVRSGDRMHTVGAHRYENGVVWAMIDKIVGVDVVSGRISDRAPPASLVNAPISELLGPSGSPDDPLRARGVMLADGQWLFLATDEELSKDYKVGARHYTSSDCPRTYQTRKLYKAKIEANPIARIASIEPIGATAFRSGAFMRSGPSGEIVRFAHPDGFLMIHQSTGRAVTSLQLSRVSVDGSVVWTAETELGTLMQILPHATMPAFVGTHATNAKDPLCPALTVLNIADGSVKVIPLRGPSN